jgi:hypothetical protein
MTTTTMLFDQVLMVDASYATFTNPLRPNAAQMRQGLLDRSFAQKQIDAFSRPA